MPSDVAFGALLFFWHLGIDLLRCTLKYLEQKKEAQMKTNSQKSGDGWGSSTYSLEAMLQNLEKLANWPFTPLSCGVLTKAIWLNLSDKLLIKNDEQG
jgi:hypothetical protein